jgi:chorismate mutase
MIKGIRGATTVEENSPEKIESATLELLGELINKNGIKKEMISHVIFALTPDLNAEFPAKFARQKLGWDDVAMLCSHELDVPTGLKMCLRVLVVLNCDENFKPEFVYLKGAKNLRA